MNATLAYTVFKENLVKLINESGLPMFAIADVLELTLTQARNIVLQQAAAAAKEEKENGQP